MNTNANVGMTMTMSNMYTNTNVFPQAQPLFVEPFIESDLMWNMNTNMNTTTTMMNTNANVFPVKHNTNTNTDVFVNNFVNDFLNDFVNKPPKPPSDKIVKFKSLTGEIKKLDCRGEIGHSNEIVENNTMKLIWGYLTATMNIGRSGEIVFDEIVVKFKFNAIGGGGAP